MGWQDMHFKRNAMIALLRQQKSADMAKWFVKSIPMKRMAAWQ
jgi:hypothetical protein